MESQSQSLIQHANSKCRLFGSRPKRPSIKYVTLFLANFDPLPLSHFVTSRDPRPESTSHISKPPPPILVGLVQKSRTKPPFTNSLTIVRGGFCPWDLSFVRKVLSGVIFAHSPFCQNTYV